MPIKTEKLSEFPVVLATYSGHITIEDVDQMYRDTAAFLPEFDKRYYHISDIRDSTTTFSDFIKIFEASQHRRPSQMGGPVPQIIFVGANNWIDSIRQATKKKLGIELPVFANLEEAMHFIELDIKNGKS